MERISALFITAGVVYLSFLLSVAVLGYEPRSMLQFLGVLVTLYGIWSWWRHGKYHAQYRIDRMHIIVFGIALWLASIDWMLAVVPFILFAGPMLDRITDEMLWGAPAKSRWRKSLAWLLAVLVLPLVFVYGPIDETGILHLIMMLGAFGMIGYGVYTMTSASQLSSPSTRE